MPPLCYIPSHSPLPTRKKRWKSRPSVTLRSRRFTSVPQLEVTMLESSNLHSLVTPFHLDPNPLRVTLEANYYLTLCGIQASGDDPSLYHRRKCPTWLQECTYRLNDRAPNASLEYSGTKQDISCFPLLSSCSQPSFCYNGLIARTSLNSPPAIIITSHSTTTRWVRPGAHLLRMSWNFPWGIYILRPSRLLCSLWIYSRFLN